MRAGQVLGKRVHVAVDVHTARGEAIELDVSSPSGHHIANVPFGVREATKLRDTLAEAIELACNPRYRAEAS